MKGKKVCWKFLLLTEIFLYMKICHHFVWNIFLLVGMCWEEVKKAIFYWNFLTTDVNNKFVTNSQMNNLHFKCFNYQHLDVPWCCLLNCCALLLKLNARALCVLICYVLFSPSKYTKAVYLFTYAACFDSIQLSFRRSYSALVYWL